MGPTRADFWYHSTSSQSEPSRQAIEDGRRPVGIRGCGRHGADGSGGQDGKVRQRMRPTLTAFDGPRSPESGFAIGPTVKWTLELFNCPLTLGDFGSYGWQAANRFAARQRRGMRAGTARSEMGTDASPWQARRAGNLLGFSEGLVGTPVCPPVTPAGWEAASFVRRRQPTQMHRLAMMPTLASEQEARRTKPCQIWSRSRHCARSDAIAVAMSRMVTATLSPAPTICPSRRLDGAGSRRQSSNMWTAVGARGTRTKRPGSTVCCRNERGRHEIPISAFEQRSTK
jgi:hypothetical protein